MARYRLRIFAGADDVAAEPIASRRTVTVSLEELFPLLADACETQRAWLRDFGDDQVTISEDLHEIVQAYAALRAA